MFEQGGEKGDAPTRHDRQERRKNDSPALAAPTLNDTPSTSEQRQRQGACAGIDLQSWEWSTSEVSGRAGRLQSARECLQQSSVPDRSVRTCAADH